MELILFIVVAWLVISMFAPIDPQLGRILSIVVVLLLVFYLFNGYHGGHFRWGCGP